VNLNRTQVINTFYTMTKIKVLVKPMLCLIFFLAVSLEYTHAAAEKGYSMVKSLNAGVYLHTDRSYYLPGEPVLFKAYFLDGLNNKTYPVNDSLHVLILDQFNVEVASGIFPVTSSRIKGSVELPDFLTEGSYILVAFTREMNNIPEKMFSSIIEIRKSVDNPLITEISLTDSIYASGGTLTSLLRFSGKDNKPVPAGFAYQLNTLSGEIVNGNNKAGSEGNATLKVQLPKFDSNETLELLVEPSFRGLKSISGVVVPTRFNRVKVIRHPLIPSVTGLPHLNISLKQTNLTNDNAKIQLDISVTDENGMPVLADLSVSVSDLIPHFLHNDNDNFVNYLKFKNTTPDTTSYPDIRQYFTQQLNDIVQSPGHTFVVQEKNNPKKLLRKSASMAKDQSRYPGNREANEAFEKSSTLFWGPNVFTDNSGNVSLSFQTNDDTNDIFISIVGIGADGRCGSSSTSYVVKH
jgi:hypothetical protein